MKKEYFIIIIIIFSLFTGCNLFEDTSGTNQKPVANAGGDKVITIGDTVLLDGSGSNDKDDDSLTYNWSFVVKPSESTAVLSDSGIENPSFTADKVGNYIIQLIEFLSF